MKTLRLLFGLRATVARLPYIAWGLGLAALKFAIDTAVVYGFTHKTWSPLGYVVPSLVLRQDAVGQAPQAMYVILPLVAMPFLWIGLSMSVRRAADAGVSPWLGTLFLVPLVNYLTIATLSALPSSASPRWNVPELSVYRGPAPEPPAPPSAASIPPGASAALAGILASMGIGVGMLWICVYGLGLYGFALFFATPFIMGAVSAAIYNRRHVRPLGATLGIAVLGVLLSGSITLLFAIEGIVCLAMAAPIAIVVAIFGALVGRAVAVTGRDASMPAMMMLALPGLATGEAHLAAPVLRDVVTTIEIDAPPEQVWPNVIGFSELDAPPAWLFRLGIAYPKRARIYGQGVGAVRRCEFSTGAFVEPITVWQPPRRLAFDVTAQPPSMTEWSPYGAIRAPHLEGYMVSRGGEFDLIPLPGGRTRLEGTTHYTLAIYPEAYWTPFAEALLHAIHQRVLLHVKRLSEEPVRTAP